MAKPHAYWVIIIGNTPTAFRAREKDTLIPTLKQLQRTQPTALLKWFDRGRLWSSPLEAHDALKAARHRPATSRGRDWRPGGAHKDPRARFEISRDEKRARFKRRLIQSKTRPNTRPPGRRPRKPKDES